MKGFDKLKNDKKTNVAQLKTRVERIYAEYRRDVIELGGEYVFDLAADIAILTDVYRQITEENNLTEKDAEFLLTFENPLKTLADEWEMYTIFHDGDFYHFIVGFVEKGDTGDNMTVSTAERLREKHGADTTFEACLMELVELAGEFLECRKNDSNAGNKEADF